MTAAPNVVLITCHDVGRFLPCFGIGTVQASNIEGLACDGVRFERMFCVAPQCSPSRASLFTGRYPQSNGVLGLVGNGRIPSFKWALAGGERHLARELAEAGYATAAVGVLHESFPSDVEVKEVHEADAVLADHLGFDAVALMHATGMEVAERATVELERLKDGGRPFYLQIGFVEPHRISGERDAPGSWGFIGNHIDPDSALGVTVPPYLVDDAGSREEMAELQGAIRYVDDAVGRVVRRLAELGLDEDTLLVFTTDHGLSLPRAKMSLYDPGLEVALILRYPRRGWSGGRAVDALTSNVDVFPTVLEAAGLDVPDRVQGRSLVPLLEGREVATRSEVFGQMTYHTYYDPRRCVRTERHKLIVNFADAPAFMVEPMWRHRSTAIASYPSHMTPVIELYDLERDPLEVANVAADPAYASVRRDLLDRLRRWMVDVGDPLLEGAVSSPVHGQAVVALSST